MIAFESYRTKLRCQDRPVIVLTIEELQRLASLQITSDNDEERTTLKQAKDVFLFMCLTGLRYSDVKNQRRCDVCHGGLVITTIKTNDNLNVNLNRFNAAILRKYETAQLSNGAALPVTSNGKLNEHIHKICKMAGITQSVRMSYYKETFVCLALSLGIDRDTIMKWTGIRTTSQWLLTLTSPADARRKQ